MLTSRTLGARLSYASSQVIEMKMVLDQEGTWGQELMGPPGQVPLCLPLLFPLTQSSVFSSTFFRSLEGRIMKYLGGRGAWSGKDGREDVRRENRGGREHSLRHSLHYWLRGKDWELPAPAGSMVPHLTSHSDSRAVGGDPEHGKAVRMLSQAHLSPSFLPSSEHLFHSGIC